MSASRPRCDRVVVARRALVLALAWAWSAPVADAQMFRRKPFDESDLIAGRAALEDGFYDLAKEHLERYIEDAPDKDRKAVGVVYLSQALIGENKMEAALELLDGREKWAREVETVAAFRYWKARALFALGRHHQALGTLRNFDTTYAETPYAGRALLLRAETFEAVGDYEAALDAHDALNRSYPRADEAPANLLNWGELLVACDRPDDALEVLLTLIGHHAGSDYAEQGLLQIGRVYTEAAQWDMAWAMLDALASDPGADPRRRVRALFAMAGIERDRGNIDPALDALARILELNPDPADQARAAVQRGRLLIDLGQPEDGLAMIQQAVLDLPSEAEAARTQLYYAETLQELAYHERAAQEFQNYLEAFTGQDGRAPALMGKGWSLWELHRYSEAAAAFDKAFAEADDPEVKADARLKSADAHFADGHYQVAAAGYLEFARMFPGHALVIQARFQEAEALARGGDMEAAQRLLQRFVDEDPDTVLSLNARMRQGLIQEEAGDWEAAIAAYNEVLGAEPDAATAVRARHRRGIMEYRLGRFREAYGDFEAVFAAADPGLVAEEACYMRGWSLYMLGRDDEAMAICRSFIETYPESTLAPHVMFWLGEYHWNHSRVRGGGGAVPRAGQRGAGRGPLGPGLVLGRALGRADVRVPSSERPPDRTRSPAPRQSAHARGPHAAGRRPVRAGEVLGRDSRLRGDHQELADELSRGPGLGPQGRLSVHPGHRGDQRGAAAAPSRGGPGLLSHGVRKHDGAAETEAAGAVQDGPLRGETGQYG